MNQRGGVAIDVSMGVTFILVPLLILVSSVPGWLSAREVVSTAAREAARAAVMAPDVETARSVASDVAQRVIAERSSQIGFHGASVRGQWERGSVIEVTVTVSSPPLWVPLWGTVGDGYRISASSRERIGEWRSLR